MQHRVLQALLGLLLTAASASNVLAGPLSDRIQAHRAERLGEVHAQIVEDRPTRTARANRPTAQAVPVPSLRDVAYGADPRQRMDVYLPPAGHPVHGVVLLVHGGGWRMGDKEHRKVVDNKVVHWVPQGLAVVSVNYRMLPDTPVLAQAEDVRKALAHAQNMAPAWRVPADRFVLMGHSAGAHLVSLVSADPSAALAMGAEPWLGVISLDSAAMDVPRVMKQRHMKLYDDAFGSDPALWRSASPWHHVTARMPPSLLVCSTLRPDRPCDQARDFAAKAHGLARHSEVLPQALSHGDINEQLGQPGAYTDAVDRFLAGLHPALAQALRS